MRACAGLVLIGLAGCASTQTAHSAAGMPASPNALELGNFSMSLTVKDLAASQAFYEKLGFHVTGGNAAQHWLIMQNGTSTIGLFQGMFDKNTLTFNPGWDRNTNPLAHFSDVREIQGELQRRGIKFANLADTSTDGPAFFMVFDPDGNPILVDQHVPKPDNEKR